MQTQVKDGLARALSVEKSIGAQDAELARITAALEALREHGGGTTNNENTTGATASSSAAADTPQTQTQTGQQEATLPAVNQLSLVPVPPEDFCSWPGSVPPIRPLGESMQQAGSHTAW